MMPFTLALAAALSFVSLSESKDYPHLTEDQIKSYDLNHDGILEPNELQAAFLALAIESESDASEAADSNDDGQVAVEEMYAYVVAVPYANQVVAMAQACGCYDDFLEKFDTNRDGKIGQAESMHAYEYTKSLADEKFQAADTNSDGKLESGEIENADKSLRQTSNQPATASAERKSPAFSRSPKASDAPSTAPESSTLSAFDRAVTQQLLDFQKKLGDGPGRLAQVAKGTSRDLFDLSTFGTDAQRLGGLATLQAPPGPKSPLPGRAGRNDNNSFKKNADQLQGFGKLESSFKKNPHFKKPGKPSLTGGGPMPVGKPKGHGGRR